MPDFSAIDYQTFKINGVYRQGGDGALMVRAKLPGGLFSAPQAEALCSVAEDFGGGKLHLTCRGNIEVHGLRGEQLPTVQRRYQAVGLTTRGACGGAVRGVACALDGGESSARIQLLVRRLHAHFTGNPHFEGLPKKFKLAVENGYCGARHLCQDLAMVYLGRDAGRDLCDVWVAGGLGRQPREGFLLAGRVPFERLIPLVEGVIRVYMQHAPAGKRLKHLLADIGEAEFRALLARETAGMTPCPVASPFDDALGELACPGTRGWIAVPVPAGRLAAADLRRIATIAGTNGDGWLAVSRDQDVLVSVAADSDGAALREALQNAGLLRPGTGLRCRVCPGSAVCPKGLVPTRELAAQLNECFPDSGRDLEWAVCGCSNSCSGPQLADIGIVGARKATGGRPALFDLYRRTGEGFGTAVATRLTLEELLTAVGQLLHPVTKECCQQVEP